FLLYASLMDLREELEQIWADILADRPTTDYEPDYLYAYADTTATLLIMGYLLVLKKFSLHLSPQHIAFDTALFWITFTGLQLEHQSPEVIKLLAAAAGIFREVDPAENAPRMVAGYRARVEVDLHKPLSQGTMTETLYMGPTWVGFEYSGVPFHSCKKCFRLTHDISMCNEAPPTVHELLRITAIGTDFQ
ncbi:hypothetical protein IFM89_012269, partial [Coptis chinensis]